MKKAFICSAYRGDIQKNAERARRYCLTALDHGYAPFAPHLLYPQFLCDESGADRYTGIQCGIEFLKCCDIVLVFGAITAGMHSEIEEAERLGMEIEYIGGTSDEMLSSIPMAIPFDVPRTEAIEDNQIAIQEVE